MCYEIGRVYIWQNCEGRWAYLNGQETTVTSLPKTLIDAFTLLPVICCETDTPTPPWVPCLFPTLAAKAGKLRPKNPPPGEQSVLDLFKQPEGVVA